MALLPSLRKKFASRRPSTDATPAEPWPLDPELRRRLDKATQQLEHTRRRLELHMPDRKRQTSRDRQTAAKPRPIETLRSTAGQRVGR
jgi:hypothetical protein